MNSQMKNFALIKIPKSNFPSEEVYGEIIYRGKDALTDEVALKIQKHLLDSGISCTDVKRSYKPKSSGFFATSKTSKYFITVSLEISSLADAELIISAKPNIMVINDWIEFEPLFRTPIESQFKTPAPKWMTCEEFLKDAEKADLTNPR